MDPFMYYKNYYDLDGDFENFKQLRNQLLSELKINFLTNHYCQTA